jgi:hypothetical protein
MRATISFETDVDRVKETMRSLTLEEARGLQQAIEILEASTAEGLMEEVDAALDKILAAGRQLHQYKDMLISFERARFETILPQSADEPAIETLGQLKDATAAMTQFDDFLNKINTQQEEEPDDPEEG